jgi:hypothetical protein
VYLLNQIAKEMQICLEYIKGIAVNLFILRSK